jgi:predicted O-methyltransferase YrrM
MEKSPSTHVTKDALSKINLKEKIQSVLKDYTIDPNEFFGEPGKEHYRLLSYLSSLHAGSTIIDIGTHRGSSALAMSTSPNTTIYSFDIQRKIFLRDLPNVNYEIADLWNETVFEYWEKIIMESAMILLDIDPHDGNMEYEIYLKLKSKGYKGLIVCDDIWFFKEMRDNFWNLIPTEEKVDITALGHWSGSGVISFVKRPDIVWETYSGPRTIGDIPSSNYTIVTAYFDLTRMPDASNAIKARPKGHYLNSSKATLALDYNLIVYCEEDSLEAIKAIRPAHLHHKTLFKTVDFETITMSKYRNKIYQNRIKYPYRGDERNTPSYYLLCMARYALLKRTMDENPFNTTHFAWLNICIERMGHNNLVHLDEIFSGYNIRDKVSTTYIDYIPKSDLVPASKYYEFGRCSLCSGFFTGSKPYLYEFCNRIEDKFMYYLDLGFGHADEQLFSPVYFDAPEIFDVYYGDYTSMITNYSHSYETKMPLYYVIPKSYTSKDWVTCINACKFVWNSIQKKACNVTNEERSKLLTMYARCAFELRHEIKCMKDSGALDAFFLTTKP